VIDGMIWLVDAIKIIPGKRKDNFIFPQQVYFTEETHTIEETGIVKQARKSHRGKGSSHPN
jgi:hypothetical protein